MITPDLTPGYLWTHRDLLITLPLASIDTARNLCVLEAGGWRWQGTVKDLRAQWDHGFSTRRRVCAHEEGIE